jgi:PIN like domain
MNDIYPQYYQLSIEQTEEMFKKCIFVFDTNVLLNMYRYPSSAKEDLLKILKDLSSQNRVWLPFQVGLEFQENRLTVISEQKVKFGEVRKVISNIQTELKEQLDKLNLKKRHSSINPDELFEKISTAFGDYTEKLNHFEENQVDIFEKDEIRSEIDELFKGKIGEPFSKKELEDIFIDGKIRFQQKRPPGYADEAEKKGTYHFYKDLQIKREFGDLIYWKEIIRFAKDNKVESLILVTDDNKEDWWLRLSGKTVGPRKELISEILASTDLNQFHMYSSEKFMEYAMKYLGIKIQDDSLTQVKEISEIQRRRIKRINMYKVRFVLNQMYEGKCQICGLENLGEICHVQPISNGGSFGIENTLLLCPNHHNMFVRDLLRIDESLNILDSEGTNIGELTVHQEHLLDFKNSNRFSKYTKNKLDFLGGGTYA